MEVLGELPPDAAGYARDKVQAVLGQTWEPVLFARVKLTPDSTGRPAAAGCPSPARTSGGTAVNPPTAPATDATVSSLHGLGGNLADRHDRPDGDRGRRTDTARTSPHQSAELATLAPPRPPAAGSKPVRSTTRAAGEKPLRAPQAPPLIGATVSR